MVRNMAAALVAGLLVAGFTKVDALISGSGAIVLLHASDGAADGAGKLDSKFKALGAATGAKSSIFRELTSAEMSLALGRLNVVHAAASEGGASRRIVLEAERLRRFRTSGV